MIKNKILKKLTYFLLFIIILVLIFFLILYAINRKYVINAQNNEYKILKEIYSPTFELKDVTINNHIYVSIDNVSPYLVNGYIVIEDQNFYKHNGVDLKAIMRAFFKILENKGKIVEGGSTITQQIVKNNILTQEQTIDRKIKEFFIALDFEKKFSKQEIMEIYLNTNYYGNGCYGVEKASNLYFGKSTKDLTIGECAVLIGVSNSPNNYNPIVNYDLCIKKRNNILEKMKNENIITKEEYKNALQEQYIIQ